MRKAFAIGLGFLILGTVLDLAFHAITEPDEAFSLSMPRFELVDHILIAIGVAVAAVVVAVAGITYLIKGDS